MRKAVIKKEKRVFLFGLELECAYDCKRKAVINKGYYHNPNKLTQYWNAETDGSLHNYNSGFDCVELTTKPFQLSELKKVVQDLRDEVIIRSGADDIEFNEYFEINKTMGHHVHFSVKNKPLLKKTFIKLFPLIRRKFFVDLKAYDMDIFKAVSEQYFRSYARKLTKHAYVIRSYEFNLTNEIRGLEWRSFNVMGVKTWKQYEKVLFIALNSVFTVINDYLDGKISIKDKMKIEFIDYNNYNFRDTSTEVNNFDYDKKEYEKREHIFKPTYTVERLEKPELVVINRKIFKDGVR